MYLSPIILDVATLIKGEIERSRERFKNLEIKN